jgi:hypothetical protein
VEVSRCLDGLGLGELGDVLELVRVGHLAQDGEVGQRRFLDDPQDGYRQRDGDAQLNTQHH